MHELRVCGRVAAASRPGGSPMDAQVGGAPVAPEAVKAAADAAKSAPTSFAPSSRPSSSGSATSAQQAAPPRGGIPAAGQAKSQPTASTPSAAELEKAASESRVSQVSCVGPNSSNHILGQTPKAPGRLLPLRQLSVRGSVSHSVRKQSHLGAGQRAVSANEQHARAVSWSCCAMAERPKPMIIP
jgi:hypothetical protein